MLFLRKLLLLLLLLFLAIFSHQCDLMVSHWSLNDGKSPPGLFSEFSPFSKMLSSRWSQCVHQFPTLQVSFPSLWAIVPSAQTTIGITDTIMFHSFLRPLARSIVLFYPFSSSAWHIFQCETSLLVAVYYCFPQNLEIFFIFYKYLYIIQLQNLYL